MIYMLHARDGGPIKIGESGSIGARLDTLQVFFPYPIEFIASFEGDRREERFIQHCFNPVTVKGIKSNEWFSSCPAIWRFALDILENGRPSFMPPELRCTDSDKARRLANKLYGGEREAMEALGYSKATPSKETFNAVGSSRFGGGIWPRLLFEDALRNGRLPSYVADLHRAETNGDQPSFVEAAQ